MSSTIARTDASLVTRVQRRTLGVLVVTQVLAGVGVAIGLSVGALLVAKIAGGPGLSGLAQSAVAVGGALLAIPVTRLMQARGRRPGLVLAYLCGVVGGVGVIGGAFWDSVPLALAGMFLFGGGIAANLQARYTAVDLADPARRGRQLSLVVWATTIGGVGGPNLSAPADRLVRPYGLPEMSGPFVFSVAAFLVAALLLWLLLRPDPLLLSRTAGPSVADPPVIAEPEPVPTSAVSGVRGPMATAFAEIRRSRTALLGYAAVASGHAVMLAVMVMTPIRIDAVLNNGHHGTHPDVLMVVGIVISLHVAGMYAFSPLVGYAADRYGRRQVILTGTVLLLVACVLAGTAGEDTVRLTAGLFLVGLGWSCTMVAGSTMLTESVPVGVRPSAQGLTDFTMGLAGALAGALSGVVVAWFGFPALALGSGLIAVPLTVAAWRMGWLARERG